MKTLDDYLKKIKTKEDALKEYKNMIDVLESEKDRKSNIIIINICVTLMALLIFISSPTFSTFFIGLLASTIFTGITKIYLKTRLEKEKKISIIKTEKELCEEELKHLDNELENMLLKTYKETNRGVDKSKTIENTNNITDENNKDKPKTLTKKPEKRI